MKTVGSCPDPPVGRAPNHGSDKYQMLGSRLLALFKNHCGRGLAWKGTFAPRGGDDEGAGQVRCHRRDRSLVPAFLKPFSDREARGKQLATRGSE